MPPKSAVERSPYRKEIENLILEGKSSRYISDWLKEQSEPENISHNAINNYRKNKFNVKEKAVKKYREKQSKKRLDKAVDKKVSEIEALDDIIDLGHSLKLDLGSLTPDYEGTSQLDIEKAKIQAKNLVIRAAKVKHDITKDEPAPVVIVKVEDTDDEEEERLIREIADDLARQ